MLSWNEIKDRATKFSREWADETGEMREYQSFWDEFFQVFDVRRRSVAVFQQSVKKLSGTHGFIDVFWPGTLIGEHKSAGEDLDSAFIQATEYAANLSEAQRPRRIIVTDYHRMRLYDLEAEGGMSQIEFDLKDFPKRIREFGFVAGYEVRKYKEQDPVNRKAVRTVVTLHQAFAGALYNPEYLPTLLVRLVFCFFADDTGIFEKDSFYNYLDWRTSEDGSGFGGALGEIFQTLNTPEDKRPPNLDEDLATLPYVNGGLFKEALPLPTFDAEMRSAVLQAASFDWGSVSPAVFGSMFQFVMDATDENSRHDFGAHYTSETNIQKVIDGLFLDELRAELVRAGKNKDKLRALQERIGAITLLDPACGCGNFLVVAYRELRQLELEVIKRLYPEALEAASGQGALPMDFDPRTITKMSVERMFGIELLPFPVEVARLSLWLADHLSNVELGDAFGKPFKKLPLVEQPHIVPGNALTTNWESVVPKSQLTYILGNPPFIGSRVMDAGQKADMLAVFGKIRELGFLDYVTAWYFKAAQYIQGSRIQVGFVSTNSITQGEQVGILWEQLFRLGVHIQFAHRTFKWTNEAPGRAAVYCVIIGFGLIQSEHPRLFEYDDVGGEPREITAVQINPYLIDAPNITIRNRQKPLCAAPEMSFGNMPRDGGALILDEEERSVLLSAEPAAEKFIRPYIGAQEFLHNEKRYCFWLVDAEPEELSHLPLVMRHVESVRHFRQISVAASTRAMSATPTLFAQRTQPLSDYVLIPGVSSENRRYIPMGFFSKDIVVANSCLAISGATLYHFGILESEMHMTWMRSVCGRLKSDYRYSKDIVYNNFPWPKDVNETQRTNIESAAQAVLDARAAHSGATLAELYNPLAMPKDLLDAHHALDRAVDHAYGSQKFASEPERLRFIFKLYQDYVQEEV